MKHDVIYKFTIVWLFVNRSSVTQILNIQSSWRTGICWNIFAVCDPHFLVINTLNFIHIMLYAVIKTCYAIEVELL
jgi:hypothetical protein